MAPNYKADNVQEATENGTDDFAILNGRIIASPPPGEEVCITGLSGVFPNSRNVHEFRDNLMNKIDMVDGDFRRWRPFHPEIPQRTGKVYDVEKFDAGFFGIHHKQAQSMDPMMRIFLEKAIEAIYDAGLNPSELEGTNTGVFIGCCFAESEAYWFYNELEPNNFAITGCTRSMIARRLAYYLKLKGISHVTDTACSSSSYAVENAYRAIRTGQCDMAIVGGTNLTLHPFVSLQFARLGVLSNDGRCKTFDESGDGYARSEAIACILLQKAKDSRRIYATMLHAKTNCDGYKEQGITYPSGETQTKLLTEFYNECNVDPRSLSFLEAHGTGTKVGDPEECSAIDEVFCKGRSEPLLVGSVKSNLGHSEPSSGLCSIAKCIIGMEEGYIPPNLHFNTPKKGVPPLEEGRMKVVSERTPFQDDRGLVATSSFGFGGGNCHILLKWNTKVKVDGGQPKDNLPRLVCISGRTTESITSLTEDVNSRKLDAEHVQLLHEIFKKDIPTHLYRGYTITSKEGEIKTSVRNFEGVKPTLLLAFGSFEDSWQPLMQSLLAFPVFAAAIQRIQDVLRSSGSGINMTEIIENQAKKVDPVVQNVLGNVALQIGIVEIIKDLDLVPDFLMGYAVGELGCAYYDGSLSLEQTVLASLEIANHIRTVNEPSSVYIINLPEAQVKKLIPPSIELIWKNSEGSVTISGPPKITQKFVESVKNIGVVVEHISSLEVTWITRRISKIESTLVQNLKKIIPLPKQRSDKWISVSSETLASPEYFVKALMSQINFLDLSGHFVDNQVVFELGIGGFAELLKNSVLPRVEVVKFEDASKKDGVVALLDVLGSLYQCGYNPQIQNLYPRIQYPVSRATPMISPKIKWNHLQDWYVMFYNEEDSLKEGERILSVSLTKEEWMYVEGHVIDGRNLFPATGYLHAVWETISLTQNTMTEECALVFENCRFNRATTVGKDTINFTIMIQRHSGNFEVVEGGTDVVSGKVYPLADGNREYLDLPIPHEEARPDVLPLKNKDIYKELRLRGYNYKGMFRGIEECNHSATVAWLKWDGNWVSFMDNMLQIKILQLDTRLLYVPTCIKKMTIDPKKHLKYVESFGDNPVLPVYVYRDADIIRCGGIEIKGLMASSIPRRKQLGDPVLEKYEFVPNELKLPIEKSIRVNMQIGLENLYVTKIKAVEVIDESTQEGSQPLGPLVLQVFSDQPVIQTNMVIFSKENLEVDKVKVENKQLDNETDLHLIIGSKILQRTIFLQQAFGSLKEEGFILSREEPDFDISSLKEGEKAGIDILSVHDIGTEKLVYFRKALKPKQFKTINVSLEDEEFTWLPTLQNLLKNDSHVIIYSQNEEYSGILGLFNCIRREPGGMNVRCFIIFDKNAPPFDPKHPFYAAQMRRNMSVNIYKNGQWGTYRHLLMDQLEEVETEHSFVNPLTRGDLSSLKWIEGSLNSKTILPPEKKLVQVYYASLNFRDVMTASGRINSDVITMDRTQQECVQGIEFAGRTSSGRRVMGMVTHGALSTLVAADSYLLWDIPDSWTMEQAATVPAVYGTVLYALVVRGKIRRGNSILIHAGTGGVGQAAINIALAYGCTVYTTVGTQEKRDFIKKLFPQLTDHHIGCSRDISFEKLIKKETKGRGVDMVLNSLAEEKLIASVRCLAKGGQFLEIGKFDLANNNSLALMLLAKGCCFHGIMLDQLFVSNPSLKKMIGELMGDAIKTGAVKPLTTNVFKMSEVEEAFRFMASGKHKGKVMIQVRKEEPVKETIPPAVLTKAHPRFECEEQKSYIVTGGLGGFGLELADWLIIRGARKIVLTSRSGIKTGYQCYRTNLWKSYGAEVKISTADITTREGCEQLITEAQELGPIESIFNLAVVLKDSLLENQSPESFRTSLGPKAVATKYLDEITRVRCPDLRDFVIFSSVSCGRGNGGQTNYGMSNSIMERICEKRKLDGYPALAIQWGAIGDVGLVAETMEDHIEMEIGGTLQQRISSCLQVMDTFLKQKEAVIVSSMVVADKKSGSGGMENIVDAIASTLGIKKESVSPHTTLAELGMDSMTAVEIKQTLEREFEVFLTAQDIRTLTFSRLEEIQQSKESNKGSEGADQKLPTGIELILRYLGDEYTFSKPFTTLPSLVEPNSEAPTVICFPGIEGFATTLKPLAVNLKAKVIGLQFCFENPTYTYKDLAKEAIMTINKLVKPDEPLNIIAYSWGSVIALETMAILEKKGRKANLVCLDGSPGMVQEMCKNEIKGGSETEIEILVLCQLMSTYLSYEIILKNKEKIYKAKDFEERMDVAIEMGLAVSTHSPQYLRKVFTAFKTRLSELRTYSATYPKIQSPVRLFKAATATVLDFAEDYQLSKLCADIKDVKVFEGNHLTIAENPELADIINEVFGLSSS
ncbi:fatty acid synthase-like [Coccinella septempunctata]|uniref:fatty acid synthase-like n=1 Tax=Coccinella septempunctata TaxID=41139 RepID=UPI001D07F9A0|nr:fatty acid synthase-like [Coccinella septempunctata]XP_044764315.1 fatty acid synthase-like [Coccinella septempunctata]